MADEPTDEELNWQGFTLDEYKRLDKESQDFLRKRAMGYRKAKGMSEIVEAIEAYVEDKKNAPQTVKSILTNESPEDRDFILNVVRKYRASGSERSIGDFYREKYKKQAPQKATSAGDRMTNLAVLMSEKENRPVDEILRTERDVIKEIIKITGENIGKGLTDEGVYNASLSIVADESHEAQFPLETLKVHKEELIKRALDNKSKKGAKG